MFVFTACASIHEAETRILPDSFARRLLALVHCGAGGTAAVVTSHGVDS